ncbi:Beta-barrel assembly machine subunit BamE [Moraxella cuniculi DSM 21768]|uniref:Beta-barrel assembly machine subunit BamE n=2 Tax=Moraxella cuniculi TaxID=34061 RepID=A0A1N7F5U5_9GAMM|nr:YgdI/YgdR family lipoprotein [Moraxella cuniculi]SIR95689.1 Beta-barrel assembly machine subunit BamE [Moraxella cuniculi DSM 21768]VEG12132.1 Uncharacterised protein [Moraxella cuniculi]
MLKNRTQYIVAAVLTALVLTGCASTGNIVMKEQNQQTIEQVITKGQTTKQDIAAHFGSADSISFTDSGKEIWTYRHSRSKPMARNFIPYNFFSFGENIQTKELVILFDSEGVVSNYTFRETANQSKAGLAE